MPDSDVIVVRIPPGTANTRILVKVSVFNLVMGMYSFESVSISHQLSTLSQAQSRRNLCVWYSIHKTEQPFIFEIEGQVQDIEKSNNVTEVLVQEDPSAGPDGVVGYQLDDNLVRAQSHALPWLVGD